MARALTAKDVFVTTGLVKIYFPRADDNVDEFGRASLCSIFTRVLDTLVELWPEVPRGTELPEVAVRYPLFRIFVAQLRSAIAGKNPNMVIGRGPPKKSGIKKDPYKVRAAALEIARLLKDERVLKLSKRARLHHVIKMVAPKYKVTERTIERYYKEDSPDEDQVRYYIAVLEAEGLLTAAKRRDKEESARRF
jgi:hypothetical protein